MTNLLGRYPVYAKLGFKEIHRATIHLEEYGGAAGEDYVCAVMIRQPGGK